MKATRLLVVLMAVLLTAAGCRAAATVPPDLAAATGEAGEAASAVAAVEPPDSDALGATPPPPPPEEFEPVPRLADIYFDYDGYEIRAEDTRVLDENAKWLRANPDTLVLIEGHTDERGTSEYNLGLGDRRAAAAMRYLLAQGVPAARMVAISYGEERPLCTDATQACWARNRRAHFLVKHL
jgi:peptidoglycan-associated lipoprotein